MPWKRYKDGEKHCVHELNEDGSKGKKLKCYDDKQKADDYVEALYANSDEEMKSVNIEKEDLEDVPVDDGGDHENDNINKTDDSSVDDSNTGDPRYQKMHGSYDQHIRDVHDAWYQEYEWSGRVKEVFDDYAIVYFAKKCWQIPYSKNEDGKIEFAPTNEWIETKMESTWTEVAEKMNVVKQLDDDRIGGWAILYGSESEKDLHDEYFTEETEEYDALFKAMGALPWLVQHASDNTIKTSVVAVVDTLTEKDAGWWYEAKIREHDLYKEYVKPLIEKKVLATSSGTLPAAKRVNNKSGEITRWPISEITGTWTPADYRQVEMPITEVKAHYKSIGVNEDLIAKFFEDDEPEAEEEGQGVVKTRLELIQHQLELERELLTI